MFRRQLQTAIKVTVVLLVIMGVIYPLAVWAVGQVAFKNQAGGSMVSRNGKVVGSSLIGQSFSDEGGKPLPQYFQPRPSAAGSGYDASASSASNLGPSSPALLGRCETVTTTDAQGDSVEERNPDGSPVCNPNTVPQRVLAYRAFNHLAAGTPVPVDAVTASGSGLDPDISEANALDQAPRVANARHLPIDQVVALVHAHTDRRPWGFLGEDSVNVLDLNLALESLP